MTTTDSRPTYRTAYERRIDLVATTITEHSALDRDAAVALAREVLAVLDHVPEHMR